MTHVRILVSLVLLAFASVSAAQYQDGLKAYLEGDFALAQEHWLKGAEKNDGRSMFNLGLLHEQEKVANASAEKAENWYRLSAHHDYVPATHHLAMFLAKRDASKEQVKRLVMVAAGKGYSPARRYLGLEVDRDIEGGQVTSSGSDAAVEPNKPQAKPVEENAEPVLPYRSDEWLNKQRPSHWTIQLLVFTDIKDVRAYIEEYDLQDRVAYYGQRKDGNTLYKLLYGMYDSKDKADFARQNLPAELSKNGPWLRPMSSIHATTKQ